MDSPDCDPTALRAERDALLNDDVNAWLARISRGTSVEDYQNSLSWRVTKPLRLARNLQLRVRRDGLVSAMSQATAAAQRRWSRR